jgi:hypothetical protein
MGYRKLAVAVFDEDRRILRASSEFNIPVSALPDKAIPIEAIPDRVDNVLERELRTRFGGLSRQWTAPDGRWYQVLLARLPLASGASDQPPSVLIALSYDRSLPRELLARYRKGFREFGRERAGAAALGIWAARVPSAPAHRRDCRPDQRGGANERLSLDDTPEELRIDARVQTTCSTGSRLVQGLPGAPPDPRTTCARRSTTLGGAQVAPRVRGRRRVPRGARIRRRGYEGCRGCSRTCSSPRADNAQARAAPQWIDLREALERSSLLRALAEGGTSASRLKCAPRKAGGAALGGR